MVDAVLYIFGFCLAGVLTCCLIELQALRKNIAIAKRAAEMTAKVNDFNMSVGKFTIDGKSSPSAMAATNYADRLFDEAGYPDRLHVYFDVNRNLETKQIECQMCVSSNSNPENVVTVLPSLLSKLLGTPIVEVVASGPDGDVLRVQANCQIVNDDDDDDENTEEI